MSQCTFYPETWRPGDSKFKAPKARQLPQTPSDDGASASRQSSPSGCAGGSPIGGADGRRGGRGRGGGARGGGGRGSGRGGGGGSVAATTDADATAAATAGKGTGGGVAVALSPSEQRYIDLERELEAVLTLDAAGAAAGGKAVNAESLAAMLGRGLHSSFFQHNLSRFTNKILPTYPLIPPNSS
jgi:hypothetical protein